MTFGSIHVPQMMNCSNFVEPLTFPLASLNLNDPILGLYQSINCFVFTANLA